VEKWAWEADVFVDDGNGFGGCGGLYYRRDLGRGVANGKCVNVFGRTSFLCVDVDVCERAGVHGVGYTCGVERQSRARAGREGV
jgi:hypothetical protein